MSVKIITCIISIFVSAVIYTSCVVATGPGMDDPSYVKNLEDGKYPLADHLEQD